MQQSITEAFGECRPSREDYVTVQRLSQIHVRSADGVNDHLVDTLVLKTNDLRVEENLWGSESFCADLEFLSLVKLS